MVWDIVLNHFCEISLLIPLALQFWCCFKQQALFEQIVNKLSNWKRIWQWQHFKMPIRTVSNHNFCDIFNDFIGKKSLIFYVIHLLGYDSHEISILIWLPLETSGTSRKWYLLIFCIHDIVTCILKYFLYDCQQSPSLIKLPATALYKSSYLIVLAKYSALVYEKYDVRNPKSILSYQAALIKVMSTCPQLILDWCQESQNYF